VGLKRLPTRRFCGIMEQFIGCDAHKKFSVFVAANEKKLAGEAVRVAHIYEETDPRSND